MDLRGFAYLAGAGAWARFALALVLYPLIDRAPFMAKHDANKIPGGYQICNGPVTSAEPLAEINGARKEETSLPAYHGMPMLLAIPRDPHTLFVCWSVDWATAFTAGLPIDRRAHVRVWSDTAQKRVPAEPTVGCCTIGGLEPGETYFAELGYYAPAGSWNVIVTGNEVMMPFASAANDEGIDVATIPFHLTFERMMHDLRDESGGRLAEIIARVQERHASSAEMTAKEEAFFRGLDLSAEELRRRAAAHASLLKSEKLHSRGFVPGLGAGSPDKGWSGSSRTG